MALTEWNDLLKRLEDEPESDILAAMLTDELMEARGMNRTEADKYVATARTAAQAVKDIEFTTHLIRSHGPAFEWLCGAIRTALGLHNGEPFTIFVTNGEGPPVAGVPLESVPMNAVCSGIAVSLPATWCRRWWVAESRPLIRNSDALNLPVRTVRRRRPKPRPGTAAPGMGGTD